MVVKLTFPYLCYYPFFNTNSSIDKQVKQVFGKDFCDINYVPDIDLAQGSTDQTL